MKILIADEQRLLRDGVRPLLECLCPVDCVFEAGSLAEAISVTENAGGVGMALLGNSMPGMVNELGLERYRKLFPSTKMVLLSACNSSVTLSSAIKAGANGVISKSSSGAHMQNALRIVMSGETYLSSEAVLTLAKQGPAGGQQDSADGEGHKHFSAGELQIIPLLLDGLSNKLIAAAVGIEEAAVKGRMRGVYKKLGVTNRAQAVWSLQSEGCIRSKY